MTDLRVALSAESDEIQPNVVKEAARRLMKVNRWREPVYDGVLGRKSSRTSAFQNPQDGWTKL